MPEERPGGQQKENISWDKKYKWGMLLRKSLNRLLHHYLCGSGGARVAKIRPADVWRRDSDASDYKTMSFTSKTEQVLSKEMLIKPFIQFCYGRFVILTLINIFKVLIKMHTLS